jgi:signal recognition particle subunit SRP54
VAGRILGMGDVVSLVERASETIEVAEAEKMAAKLAKGQFDMNDLRQQIGQMQRMGGLGALAAMMPGMGKMKAGAADEKALGRLDAIISSMTKQERAKPEILQAKRKIRIAKGAGTTVQEVNKLLKMHQEMANAMKKIRKMGGLGKLAGMFGKGGMEGMLGGLGGMGIGGGGAGGAPPAGLPGLPGPGGSAPFNLPKGFDKFLKK